MSHYTLSWHDQQNNHHEIGEYANDAFEAVRNAREDVPYLHDDCTRYYVIRYTYH